MLIEKSTLSALMKKPIYLLFSCEHAVNSIPREYQHLFTHHTDKLHSHLGYDIGAEFIASHLALTFQAEYHSASASRLLIDCNRSLSHKSCFSQQTAQLSAQEKTTIIQDYYHAYRLPIIESIKAQIARGYCVLHLSIHSFTPILNNQKRMTDIGLLYDPRQPLEKSFAKAWQIQLRHIAPQYRVRMNYPYLGISDGFTQSLRKQWPADCYIGLEVESNQALMQPKSSQRELTQALTDSLKIDLNSV